ncbi:hypothetical protein EIP86_000552 [Pleurotus ostreatoroseus]|nr:hypothetical protein EIP86_000552 [Pleurotus ostreatoroseus]
MNANKPRESVLFMFDPLSTPPETPTREVHSPDSSSDKENDAPSTQPGQLTAFFNRVYTKPKTAKAPREMLIDIGDILGVAAQQDTIMTTSDSDENNFQDRSNGVQGCGDDAQPLVDIKLEKVPPAAVHIPPTIAEESADNMSFSQRRPSWSVDSFLAHSRSTAAPAGTPLADVINSINLGSLDIHAEPESPPAESIGATSGNCPHITVEPPEAEPPMPVSAMPLTDYASPFLSPAATPPVFSPPVRRQHTSTSPNDPRRASVDLHSSFSLQMQSSEMSFDLLNDKISFISQGQDSFSSWPAVDEDDTMDLAKEEYKMKIIAEKYESIKEEDEIEPVPQEKLQSPKANRPSFDTQEKAISAVLSQPVKSIGRAGNPSSVTVSGPDDGLGREKVASSAIAHATELEIRASAPGVPSIPALRTIMKSFKAHDRTLSSSSSSTVGSVASRTSAGTNRSASRAGSDSSDHIETHVPQPKTGNLPARGIQRPLAGVKTIPAPASSRIEGPLRTSVSSAVARTTATSSSNGTAITSTRRASLGPHSAVQHPSGAATAASNNLPATTKTSRLSIVRNTLIGATNESTKISTSGQKASSKIPTPGSGAVGSGLPRPATKLPMSSRGRTSGIKASATLSRK